MLCANATNVMNQVLLPHAHLADENLNENCVHWEGRIGGA
jgi:hypothetical protein